MIKCILKLHVTNKLVKRFLALNVCCGERKVLYTCTVYVGGPTNEPFHGSSFIEETIIPR